MSDINSINSYLDFAGLSNLRAKAKDDQENAAKEVGLNKPLVVRLEGTNVEMGMEILKNSGFPITPVPTMDQAAKEIVQLVKG